MNTFDTVILVFKTELGQFPCSFLFSCRCAQETLHLFERELVADSNYLSFDKEGVSVLKHRKEDSNSRLFT